MEFIPFQEATATLDGKTYTVMQLENQILRQRRLELSLTQAQVAQRAGILLRQYARMEANPGALRASGARILLSVCAVLKLDPYLFFPEIPDNSHAYVPPSSTPVKVIRPPARPSRYIPLDEYMHLMQQVPAGKVVTAKTVDAYFQKKYNVEVVIINLEGSFVQELNMTYPFWRQLSANGQLYATTRFKSRDQQKQLLEADGLEIVPCGAGGCSLKVKDYKQHLFDLNSLL